MTFVTQERGVKLDISRGEERSTINDVSTPNLQLQSTQGDTDMKLFNSLTHATHSPSKTLTFSGTQTITYTVARRATISAAMILATGLAACGEEGLNTAPEIDQTEALISASDIAVEELELQSLALSATEDVEISQVCNPQNLINRGRDYHPQNPDRSERAIDHDQMEFDGHEMGEEVGGARDSSTEEQAQGERSGRGQRARRRQRQRRRPHPRRALIMMAYDIDGDGQLNEAERMTLSDDLVTGCEAQHARILEEFDSDESGDLDEDELSLAREALNAHRQARRDLHQERREAHRAATLEEFDADGDGELSRRERRAAHEAKRAQRRARLMETFDADGDGALSEEELAALVQSVRERIQSGQRAEPESDEE